MTRFAVDPLMLRSARVARGLTRHQLAVAIGASPLTIARWERGKAVPNVLLLAALAQQVRRPMGDFVREVSA